MSRAEEFIKRALFGGFVAFVIYIWIIGMMQTDCCRPGGYGEPIEGSWMRDG